MNHLFDEINSLGWTLCYAWQDGALFRVNLRRQEEGHDLISGGVAHDFQTALEEAMMNMESAERIDNDDKVQTFSIDRSAPPSLAARLGLVQPIVRRF